MADGGTGSHAWCCGVDGVDGVDGVAGDNGDERVDGDDGVEGDACCQWLSVALSVSEALTLVQRPRTMRVVTVDSVRVEVHGNVFEPAAMLLSTTSQTAAKPPRVVGDTHSTWRTLTQVLRKKTSGRESAVTHTTQTRIQY